MNPPSSSGEAEPTYAFSRLKAPVFDKQNSNPLDDTLVRKLHDTLEKKKTDYRLEQDNRNTRGAKKEEITRLKYAMKQIEYESVKKQQLIEERYKKLTHTFSETSEQINLNYWRARKMRGN
ncbi:hypothetical protein H4Q26_007512 [Puccinia striiformis f. sp. tritici PST-130]|nr:hypothetical protein H4Q26_007512 [Puccinia striiformis f. sp. tritici PST-130]